MGNINKKRKEIIRNYYNVCISDPSQKDKKISSQNYEKRLPKHTFNNDIDNLIMSSQDHLERFCVLKYAFSYRKLERLTNVKRRWLKNWINTSVYVGAYSYILGATQKILGSKSLLWKKRNHKLYLVILLGRGKAFRNLGKYDESLNSYREGLKLAESVDNVLGVSVCLLRIGKVYGNYLGQKSLLSLFIEEAINRLREKKATDRDTLYQLGICYSALGQAYRDSDGDKAERYFYKALETHKAIENPPGISRAMCHIAHHKFKYLKSSKRKAQVDKFLIGIEWLHKTKPLDERGLGIRYTQLAEMFHIEGNPTTAKHYLDIGRGYILRYSDYKTLVKSKLVESQLDKTNSSSCLKKGMEVAHIYNLLLQEAEINLEFTKWINKFENNPLKQSITLFKRNNEIYSGLISKIKANLNYLAKIRSNQKGSSVVKEIFGFLNKSSSLFLLEKISLDYENVTNQLISNQQSLIKALERSEKKKMEMITFQVVNSVARSLLHEYKIALNHKVFKDALKAIRNTKLILSNKVINIGGPISRSETKELIKNIESYEEDLLVMAEDITELREKLSENIKRSKPEKLNDYVSLKFVCEQLVEKLRDKWRNAGISLNSKFEKEIELLFNRDLMLVVIQNLLQNSYEALREFGSLRSEICVEISSNNTGNIEEGNTTSQSQSLKVLNIVQNHEDAIAIAARIRKALQDGGSQKKYGAGVGIDLATLVFRDLLGARIVVVEKLNIAGLEIIFRASNRNLIK